MEKTDLIVGRNVILTEIAEGKLRVLGCGTVKSLDARQIVHGTELGGNHMQVEVDTVIQYPLHEGEDHEFCVGSILKWEKTMAMTWNQESLQSDVRIAANSLIQKHKGNVHQESNLGIRRVMNMPSHGYSRSQPGNEHDKEQLQTANSNSIIPDHVDLKEMMNSKFQVGDTVFLTETINGMKIILGSGAICNLDPKKIVHGTEMGIEFMQIRVASVEKEPVSHGEDHEFLIGSILKWRRDDVITQNISSSGGSNDLVNSDSTVDMNDIGSYIPRERWAGMTVKVLNETGFPFASATIQLINMKMPWRGQVIGDENVILYFNQLNSDDPDSVSLYRQCQGQLSKWSISRIIFDDGKSGKYHHDQYKLHNMVAEKRFPSMGDPQKKRKYTSRVRNQRKDTGKLKKSEREMLPEMIRAVGKRTCCKRLCTLKISCFLVKKARTEYFAKSFDEKKAFTIDVMINNIKIENGQKLIGLQGIPVCLTAWRIVHCQGRSQFSLTMRDVANGIITTTHGNRGSKKMTDPVVQALCTMKAMIDENAEYHPAKIRILADNSHAVKRQLPCSMTWTGMQGDCNSVNEKLGLKLISQSKLSELRKCYFKEVDIHKMGDNFSKCTKCCEFKHRKPLCRTAEEKLFLEQEKEEHLDQQRQGRALYYAWRDDALRHPESSVCIMHDKMDHNKTSTPRYAECPKQLDGLQKMPITVTGILTHGRAPYAITQYNVACWPSDSNATIGSIASTIRMLEDPRPSTDMFLDKESDTNELFSALLCGRVQTFQSVYENAFVTCRSDSAEGGRETVSDGQRKLPKVLRLQLDNCSSDNKNKYIFAYLSLLVAKGIFQEVELAFLMVGHTHEDVDAMFGHFSFALTHKTNLDLMSMMKNFHDAYANSESRFQKPNSHITARPGVPTFVQEVPDFKSWIDPFLFTGADAFVGIREPRRFRFYMRSDGMPCVQYMLKSCNAPWLPENGLEMWKWKDSTGSTRAPDLPLGSPRRAPITEIKMLEDVIKGIGVWIRFFNSVLKRSEGSVSAENYQGCVLYWNRILNILTSGPMAYDDGFGDELKFGFWPNSRWRETESAGFLPQQCAMETDDHYFGPKSARPKQSFNPLIDVDAGDFVLCRPHDEDIYPVFLGLVKSSPRLGDVNEVGKVEHVFDVQWYCPKQKRKQSELEQWENCWTKQWIPTPVWKELGVLSTVVWSFKLKKGANLKEVRISPKNVKAAKDNLGRCLQADNMEFDE